MNKALGPIAAALIGLFMLVSASLYTVDQRQHAVVFQLGEVKDVISQPGLHFKWPMIQNVRYFDTRIQTLDDPEPLRFITSEKKPVLVDSYVKWRIIDTKQFYISVQGDEVRASKRLQQTITDGLQAEFGKRTVHDVVSGERDAIMELMRDKADQDARKIGVQIIDVRMKRVDLPQEVSESVYRRMEAERKRVANELRSTGSAEAERIRADADKQREVILAEAYGAAQRVKGEGDAKSSAIYAQAFQQNPEFYSFYRSMEAYSSSFRGKSDLMVIDPSSEFFKYLKDSSGKTGGRPGAK